MRYYSIQITPKDSNNPPPTLLYNSQLKNGQPNTSALQLMIDAPVTVYSLAENSATIEIWGINQNDAKQCKSYNECLIDVYAGMQSGLPLANPKQAGLILHGVIQQSFFNWIGTALVLNFVVMADTGLINKPANIQLQWLKGQKISDALTNCIGNAFPGPIFKTVINIEGDFIATKDNVGVYQNLSQLAWHINTMTKQMKDSYQGIDFYYKDNEIHIFDQPNTGGSKKISLADMVQQPVLIEPLTMQCYLVLRGDLSIGDIIELPKTPYTTQSSSFSQYPSSTKNSIMMPNSKYWIKKIRHFGNFRSANPLEWITIVDAVFA